MFENVTSVIQGFQLVNYQYILSNIIGPTYLEVLAFTLGMFFYAVFVWFFYKKLSKRDIFELNLEKYDLPEVKWKGLKKSWSSFLYVLNYWFLFPLYVLFWFFVLSLFLFFMAKNVSVRQIALMSIVLVATVRITSYFNEEWSQDLAKLMPLTLLAIFLIDPSFFSWNMLLNRLKTLSSLWEDVLQFITFTIFLEWILRICYGIKTRAVHKRMLLETPQPVTQ